MKVEPRNPSNEFEIAKIEYLYEDDEGSKVFHAHYFMFVVISFVVFDYLFPFNLISW